MLLIVGVDRNGSPILVTLVSFWHYAIVRRQLLTPSIAFTSILGKVSPSIWTSFLLMRCRCSLYRDEVCSQCPARNFHQHAAGPSLEYNILK